MLLLEHDLSLPRATHDQSLIAHFRDVIERQLPGKDIPVRFAITHTTQDNYRCELGTLAGQLDHSEFRINSIFDFRPRSVENVGHFNGAFLVPTGIGAELGGHAGDACPVARLLSSVCDTLITHPNVVNASDINELPDNALYVEGSVITRLLMGTAALQPVRANRVLLVIDDHKDVRIAEMAINAASAARAAMGVDCVRVVKMAPPIGMRSRYSSSGSAVGRVEDLHPLCDVLSRHRGEYDAVAIASVIDVPKEFHLEYFQSEGSMVNPWGGVEAMLTHAVSMMFNVPSAHSPMMESMGAVNLHSGIVDPRMSAESISSVFLHCVLKGLHRSPRIVTDERAFTHPGLLSAADVSCLVIPDGCVGLPTLAALQQGIPVIAVRENRNLMRNDLTALPFQHGKLMIVDNYLEAVGVMASLKAGVALPSVRRPIPPTQVSVERTEPASEQSVPVAKPMHD